MSYSLTSDERKMDDWTHLIHTSTMLRRQLVGYMLRIGSSIAHDPLISMRLRLGTFSQVETRLDGQKDGGLDDDYEYSPVGIIGPFHKESRCVG
ncbi:hypothetical protein CVT25_003228 [Psilocybe cyanescens]|uniref:Uncharacterized protein n=1 Tax=Psilocybe cyanescens TaxID=93625 RepID=A0A409WM42_PSICY|nr:hypothetical protein CVT25_003228 [Psilocybe cyanescens]